MKKLSISICSDAGRVRKNNEDNFVINSHYNEKSVDFIKQEYKRSTPAVVGIFDGMGGTLNGEEASLLCARETTQLVHLLAESDDAEKILRRFYGHMNRVLLRRQLETKTEIGTTACVTAFVKNEIIFTNVGDSPAFLIQDGEIQQITKDDNQAQLLLDMKTITAEQAQNHPMKNMLTQYMGMGLSADSFEPEPHIISVERKRFKDCTVVMCSDGVSGVLTADEIMKIVDESSEPAQALVTAALNKGSSDNVTAAVIKTK